MSANVTLELIQAGGVTSLHLVNLGTLRRPDGGPLTESDLRDAAELLRRVLGDPEPAAAAAARLRARASMYGPRERSAANALVRLAADIEREGL